MKSLDGVLSAEYKVAAHMYIGFCQPLSLPFWSKSGKLSLDDVSLNERIDAQ